MREALAEHQEDIRNLTYCVYLHFFEFPDKSLELAKIKWLEANEAEVEKEAEVVATTPVKENSILEVKPV